MHRRRNADVAIIQTAAETTILPDQVPEEDITIPTVIMIVDHLPQDLPTATTDLIVPDQVMGNTVQTDLIDHVLARTQLTALIVRIVQMDHAITLILVQDQIQLIAHALINHTDQMVQDIRHALQLLITGFQATVIIVLPIQDMAELTTVQ